ncbi:MAG: NAD(P)-dependent oxidoreductase [Candidatus Thalassarchaeaceae archaeon]|jgi:D-3-phosphoglycerate dehydrogenase|nr:NAD(P)-dependent oxidoreductase [Candidatus Thalassarchaeaceae archaeon]
MNMRMLMEWVQTPHIVARIAVTDGMAEAAVAKLVDAGHDVDLNPGSLDGFDAVVIRSATKMTAEAIAAAPSLQLIGRAGVGVDNIDLNTATSAGILVCNTPGSSTQSVVELTLGHLLASTRHIPTADRDLRSGKWTKKSLKGTELAGKRLGFIGFGRIAQGVGRIAHAIGMELHAYDPYLPAHIAEEQNCTLHADVNDVFLLCTHIAIHCNLTEETHHLVNSETLNMMPGIGADGTACGNHLVSCARGGVVNESDALIALENGTLSSCALDVFEVEPADGNPILMHENFHGTPHIGAATREAQARIGFEMADLLIGFFAGQVPHSVVNRAVLE